MEPVTTPEQKLSIRPSRLSSPHDFDFLQGKWSVHNRKLRKRLAGCDEWDEFSSGLHMRKTLNGFGNAENYYAHFSGIAFEGMAIRLFNPLTRLWTIYWIDSNTCTMDEHPVTGSFENRIGKFYGRDECNGQPVIMLYQWDATDPEHPEWSQAFSADNGISWECNWIMRLTRID